MAIDDIFSGQALKGGLSGGLTGLIASGGNPIGGLAGAGVGLIGGAIANSKRNEGVQQTQEQLMSMIGDVNEQKRLSYAQRIADLKQAQSFYGPAMNAWNNAYGRGEAAPADPTSVGLAGMGPKAGRF